MDIEIRVMNGTVKLEESPERHGTGWLNFSNSEIPELTPNQMRSLATALRMAAGDLED